jgi:hypothetical protein
MSRTLLLSCEGISKSYGVQPLFQDLSFALYEGIRSVSSAPSSGRRPPAQDPGRPRAAGCGDAIATAAPAPGLCAPGPDVARRPNSRGGPERVRLLERRDAVDTAGQRRPSWVRPALRMLHQTVAALSAGWRNAWPSRAS